MYFAEYVQFLYEQLKSVYSSVPDFMGELLDAALSTKQPLSTSSLKNFFAGKTEGKGKEKRIVGDTIGHSAVEHFGKIDSEGLKQKLAEMINEAGAASEICSAFKKECPKITPDDVEGMAESLTVLFKQLIKNAKNEYLSNKKSKPTGSANNAAGFVANEDNFYLLLQQLEKRVTKLFSDFISLSANYATATQEEKARIDKVISNEHYAFTHLNDELHSFVINFPFRELTELYYFGGCFLFSQFDLRKQSRMAEKDSQSTTNSCSLTKDYASEEMYKGMTYIDIFQRYLELLNAARNAAPDNFI